MRIIRLDLIAFGPFTGAAFDFAPHDGRPGLHVVYGPNEAGKSSTLRALRAALFGFPHQTGDNFLHPYDRLQVGATLEGANGDVLSFIRRKRIKNSLLDVDGRTPLPDGALRPYLGGLREEEFFSTFAIGYRELREGGREVLQGQGRLGETLFMATAGLPRLRRVEQSLNDDANKLFLRTGKNPAVNEALARIGELRKAQKEKYLRPEDFTQRTEALAQAKAERTAVEEEIAELRVKRTRLERLSASLPAAARLRQFRSEREALGEAPRLAAEFTQRREALEGERRSLAGRSEQLEADLNRTTEQLGGLAVPDDLLAAGPEIERLFKRLGSHEKAAADMQERLAERAQLEADAKALLRSVRPDLSLSEVEPLRLTRQEQATVRELAAHHRELASAIKKHDEATRRLGERIAEAEAELERLGPEASTDRLRRVVKQASREGDLDEALAAAEAEAAELKRRLDAGLSALPLWSGPTEDLVRLPVPPAATIDRFDVALAALDREASRLGERRSEAEGGLRDAERMLEQDSRDGDVPSEDALREHRRRRDLGWHEVRRELDGRGAGPDRPAFLAIAGHERLPDAYEAAVRDADEIADRLRTEAERVERLAALRREAETQRGELERLAAADGDLQRQREELLADWAGHWRFLAPLTPREMREWSGRHADLVRLAEQHRAAAARGTELRGRIARHRAELTDALPAATAPGPPNGRLGRLVELADGFLAESAAAAERRRSRVAERERAERELRETELAATADRQEFAAVDAEWKAWKVRLSLSESSKSDAVIAVLDTLGEVFKKRDAIESLRERVEGMRHDAAAFANDVRATAGRFASDLADKPFEEAAATLHARLIEARSRRDRHDELSREQGRMTRDLADATRRLGEIDAEMTSLCRQAGCDDPSELPAAEQRAADRRRLDAQIEEAEEELRQLSGGRSIAEFLGEIDAADPDTIKPDLERTKEREVEVVDQRVQLEGDVREHEQELSRMTGGFEAASAAEDAQAVVARLAADVEKYARLRFAARLLRDGRERYRKRTGNAVLDRAGTLFATLTCERFTGLAVDYGENDEPILVGIRRDGGTVRVEGMSDGTADQLYLALRLAGLSAWLDAHEPLPFVVDDILVHFDDARSVAALRALASLAEKTQVILFTHHAHVVELARGALSEDVLRVHELRVHDLEGAKPQEAAVAPEAGGEPLEGSVRSKRSLV